MKKLIYFSSAIASIIFLTSCTSKIVTTSGLKYRFVDDTKESFHYYVDATNLQVATEEEIRSASTKPYDGEPVLVKNAKEAAKGGADILDKNYTNWSEAGTVVVSYNDVAGAFIIHGQYVNRKSEPAGIGVVVIDAETGEVLCLTFDNSSS